MEDIRNNLTKTNSYGTVRPVNDPAEAIGVTLGISLQKIKSVNEDTDEVELNIWEYWVQSFRQNV